MGSEEGSHHFLQLQEKTSLTRLERAFARGWLRSDEKQRLRFRLMEFFRGRELVEPPERSVGLRYLKEKNEKPRSAKQWRAIIVNNDG